MKRLTAFAVTSVMVAAQFGILIAPAQAAVSTWDKGANVYSTSTTDFSSATFQQSLRNLKATGATYVSLIYTVYQSNTGSTDIGAGWNTPTDASLASAIQYAHSIGLAVSVTIHLEDNNDDWRAYINPSDRTDWYKNYSAMLNHVGSIAQANNAEMMVIGVEMVDMASNDIHSDNGAQWTTMIQSLRGVFKGKLVYDANSNDNSGDPYSDEKASIGFWNQLDYVGLSAYYSLNTSSNDVQSLEAQWDMWNTNDIKPFEQQVGKPILFSEVGYESIDNAHTAPWNSGLTGNYNPTEQANDYNAFLSYWNNYPYIAGVFFWNWDSNPNAGGAGDTSYTPQNKPAQQIMTQWFTDPTPPGTSSSATPAFTTSASVNPSSPSQGSAATINATIQNTGGAVQNGIVDVEVYDQNNNRVLQQFSQGQTLNTNQTQTYTFSWTPTTAGTYHVEVGVFNSDWSQNYSWNGSAATVTVSSSSNSSSSSGNSGSSGNQATSGGSFTLSGSATPTASGANLTASVKDSSAGNALVDMEVYQNGNKVFQQSWDNQTFSAGQTLSFNAPVSLPAGSYTLELGVFTPGWSQVEAWDSDAATFTVSGSSSTSGGGSQNTTPPPSNTTQPTTPSSSASIDQNGQTVNKGGSIDFSGRGFSHEESVTITLNGQTVATVHADGGGNFSTGSLSVPSTTGTYTYTFTGSSGDSATAIIHVQ